MGHVLTHGNGYAEIQRTGRGATYGLHLLDPATTAAVRVDGKLRYRIADGKYLVPANVLHLAGLGYDGITGYSYVRLRAVRSAWASPRKRTPPITSRTAPSPAVWSRRPRSSLPRRSACCATAGGRHAGPGRRHRLAVLQQGAKWNSTSTDPEKAQLIESRKYQLLEVLRPGACRLTRLAISARATWLISRPRTSIT